MTNEPGWRRLVAGSTESLKLDAGEPLRSMYTLSPFVWREGKGYAMLLRAVPRRDDDPAMKIAEVYYGVSRDGLAFTMDRAPAIAPGPAPEDADGCEDPSVAIESGQYHVYYTGWNQRGKTGNLMLARGPDPRRLQKAGVVLGSAPGHMNPKEATIVRGSDGRWVLFYEFAEEGRSKIGQAESSRVDGPWSVRPSPFVARDRSWDEWHLSTGPVVRIDGRPVMFYNGATRDAKWRIGWVVFDDRYESVIDRGIEPLITPPERGDGTDIAFASSAVELDDTILLYYSLADKDMKRATICMRPAS